MIRIFSVFIVMMIFASEAAAGPFTDKDKWGDLFLAGSVFYAYGMVNAQEDTQGAVQLFEAIVAAQLATEILKRTVKEERPNGNGDKSFPSGHAAGAFSGAMFIHKRYGWKPAIAPYVMSGIVAWSRVEQKAHYWHDVAVGAGVSALCTWLLVDKYNVQVSATTESIMVNFQMNF